MSLSPLVTDSVLLSAEPDTDAAPVPWPSVDFPPYTDQLLGDFLARLSSLAAGNLADGLSTLSEPGLYALAAALARSGFPGDRASVPHDAADVVPALLAELRRRGCRGMGTNPTGPVRRGRLLQLIGPFTSLTTSGAAPSQRDKLAGECPFCASGSSFQVSLSQVSWQCFSCARQGALPEFAERLLETIASPPGRGLG